MGWDAFGLPAENAANERGEDPETWTLKNIESMRAQLKAFNYSFDWEREFATCDPTYYKWTQYLFIKMFEKGLAYRMKALVNWDPIDKTVLADEQVDNECRSWRSGAKVEKKLLKQWFLRATAFSKELSDGLSDDELLDWPTSVRKIQKHWIGDCTGCRFTFQLHPFSPTVQLDVDDLSIWTRTPEAIFGAVFIALAPSHILVKHLFKDSENVAEIKLENICAIHPFTRNKLPVFISNKVPYPENCDSFLGIPGACEDAEKFANLHNLQVIEIYEKSGSSETTIINSDQFTGLKVGEAKDKISTHAKKIGVGGDVTSSKLRDWLISRQRFWGTPIPIIYCQNCNVIPVPSDDLPVILPKLEREKPSEVNDLIMKDWMKTTCPKCGGDGHRETDTMDTFVDSSWYFLRFLDPCNSQEPFAKDKVNEWMPVDIYIGGIEHAFLHLYYARLVNHFCHSLHLVSNKEPFRRLLVQGLIRGETFRLRDGSRQYLQRNQVVKSSVDGFVEKDGDQRQVDVTWEKMSKSKFNGVEPKEVLDEYGIDTTRLFILAGVSPATDRNWSSDLFPGVLNWQLKVWELVTNFRKVQEMDLNLLPSTDLVDKWDDDLFESRNYCIKRVNYGFNYAFAFNGAISYMQSLTRVLQAAPPLVVRQSLEYEKTLADLIRFLAPMAPHFASELWLGLITASTDRIKSWNKNVLNECWPEVDLDYNLDFEIKDGKSNKKLTILKISRSRLDRLSREMALEIAFNDNNVKQYLNGRQVCFKRTSFSLIPAYRGQLHLYV